MPRILLTWRAALFASVLLTAIAVPPTSSTEASTYTLP